jgi:somatic embryogenesis receptor kinase 1
VCGECAVKSLFSIKQAFEDPENVLVSWDPNYLSPCTFAFVECDDNNSVSGLYVLLTLNPHSSCANWANIFRCLQYGFVGWCRELPPHGLSGSLSPLIGSLPSLQRLYVPPSHSQECHAWINFYYTTCILVIKASLCF